jgi:mannose-6-phosphate isomerase-like protein (cupin superfamily)
MADPATLRLAEAPHVRAVDGSDVTVLLRLEGGSMAHFALGAGRVTQAIEHRTVSEIWFVLAGRGEMWRATGGEESIVGLEPGVCLTIPVGTRFQFRAFGDAALGAVAVTMPAWPGDDEAVPVAGCSAWTAEWRAGQRE